MKKLISVFLSLILVFSLFAVPAAAETQRLFYEKLPIIYFGGNGEAFYDSEGNPVDNGFSVLGSDESVTKDKVIETCANILLPFLISGLPFDEWDAYGDAIYEELAPLWEKVHLDGDGNSKYGVDVSSSLKAASEAASKVDTGLDGEYDIYDYRFMYDWRLSPYDHVDRLHAYVQKVMATTNASQVCLATRCLGGNLLTAYLEKYGHLGHVKKIFFSEILTNGCAYISDSFSGNIELNDRYLQSYLVQTEYCAENGLTYGIGLDSFLYDIIHATVDLFVQTGVMDTVLTDVEALYARLYKALLPSFLHATGLATYANYWGCVYDEDFEAALNLMYGQEGSEKRTEYAGLIEKIRYYNEHVSSKVPELYKTFSEVYGIEIGVLAKYGYMDMPFTAHYNEDGDVLVGVTEASMGATSGDVLSDGLSESYISSRIEEGYEDCISPDGKIDASTCLFPETTWIMKNCSHQSAIPFEKIADNYLKYNGSTVYNNKAGYNRFLVWDEKTDVFENMTEDNCPDNFWLGLSEKEPTIETRLASLIRFLTVLVKLLTRLINGEINFGGLL